VFDWADESVRTQAKVADRDNPEGQQARERDDLRVKINTPSDANLRMLRRHVIGRAAGITRSLITYYGPVWRRRQMEAFYRQFLQAGDLAFDVGAHVGNRVRVFRRIGARVIAVEPQPDFIALLRLLYGRDSGVSIEASGVAAEPGQGKLHLSRRTPTVSTFADSWRDDVQADRRFQRIRWDSVISVPLASLDELIARHGEPQFCKIDVEGFEHQVLSGLSQPLAALSFEYIPVAAGRAIACVERTSVLGDYRYRHSRVETHRWASPGWLESPAIIDLLNSLPNNDRSGDVYAVRTDLLSAAT
jgi:FkbM family methyltransferase